MDVVPALKGKSLRSVKSVSSFGHKLNNYQVIFSAVFFHEPYLFWCKCMCMKCSDPVSTNWYQHVNSLFLSMQFI